MNYGISYMGSKNSIAEWIVDLLPSADNFYDLFAGGGAITHRAMIKKKYKNYYLNDVNDMPKLFLDVIKGKYKDEHRWISREEFFEKKEQDPYIRYIWSFGNVGRTYVYNKKIEEEICFSNSVYERKILLRHLILKLFDMGLLLCKCNDKKSDKLKERLDCVFNEGVNNLLSVESIMALASLERLNRLNNINVLDNLFVSIGDYRDVEIKKGSVIYCDIPYRNVRGYNEDKGLCMAQSFNYEAFYSWCERQIERVFISEYWMPEDRFKCIGEKEKLVKFITGKKRQRAIEKVFIPIGQV